MAQNDVQPQVVMPFEEEKSNFDIMEWVLRIIRHWYLFVIAGVIAFSLAYLKNKSVIERYLTTGTMIIQESGGGGYGAQSLMHGFGVEAGYKNVNNQLIIMGSYDLIRRTVDSLPFMNVEYIPKVVLRRAISIAIRQSSWSMLVWNIQRMSICSNARC